MQKPLTPEQLAFVEQVKSVSPEVARWASDKFASGYRVETVKDAMRQIMRAVTPLREAEAPIRDEVSRVEHEFNLGWAASNPELFVQSVTAFQKKAPVTHWQHHIDLSLNGYVKLIAVRRKVPFGDVQAYLADGGPFLREIGMRAN